jgi:hypothetical protein
VKVNTNRERKANSTGKALFLMSFVLCSILLFSCEDSGILKADQNFSSGGLLKTIAIDTFTVNTSTVLIDSIPTSNTGTLLVGSYRDNLIGSVNASTYSEVAYVAFPILENQVTRVFDSVRLILPYNRFSFGDTTKVLSLKISELEQNIELRSLPTSDIKTSIFNPKFALYNTSKVNYSNTPLVIKNVYFSPNRTSVSIKLPTVFGERLYNTDKQIPSSVKPNEVSDWFRRNYLKGLHIFIDPGVDASIAGFNMTGAVIRLYYTDIKSSTTTKENKTHDFPMNAARQFNSIIADRTGSTTQSLLASTAIPSTATSNTTFVQSGVGIYTKIEFPSLKQFFKNSGRIFIDAQLEVPIVQNTYGGNTKPSRLLTLYTTDQSNIITDIVPAGNSALTAQVILDNEYQLSKAVFQLTGYLDGQIKADFNLTPLALLTQPSFFSETRRMAIGNRFHPTNKIKLIIYYSQYGSNK